MGFDSGYGWTDTQRLGRHLPSLPLSSPLFPFPSFLFLYYILQQTDGRDKTNKKSTHKHTHGGFSAFLSLFILLGLEYQGHRRWEGKERGYKASGSFISISILIRFVFLLLLLLYTRNPNRERSLTLPYLQYHIIS